MARKDFDTHGIWCRQDRKFYTLNTGAHYMSNPTGRIINTLISRGLIEYDVTGTKRFEEPYKIMNLKEAKEEGFEVVEIPFNTHVAAHSEKKTKAVKSAWD